MKKLSFILFITIFLAQGTVFSQSKKDIIKIVKDFQSKINNTQNYRFSRVREGWKTYHIDSLFISVLMPSAISREVSAYIEIDELDDFSGFEYSVHTNSNTVTFTVDRKQIWGKHITLEVKKRKSGMEVSYTYSNFRKDIKLSPKEVSVLIEQEISRWQNFANEIGKKL